MAGRFRGALGRRHAGSQKPKPEGKTWLNEYGDVVSHAQTVVERFIPVDADTITYRATVTDPLVYSRPWTIELPLKRQPEELLEVACHEDNADLQHLKEVRDAWRAEQAGEAAVSDANRRITVWTAMGALIATWMSVPSIAHHSFAAEYDQNKPINMTGTVTLMKWSNPHGWLYMDITGADGKTVNWSFELTSTNALIRAGWKKDDVPPAPVAH
jgi:hypothetical protein